MEFESVVRGRRSIRAYTDQPVPDDLVREILDEARWAPSSRNTQAWSVWVVTGEALERFKAAFKAAARSARRRTPPTCRGRRPRTGRRRARRARSSS